MLKKIGSSSTGALNEDKVRKYLKRYDNIWSFTFV